MLRAAIIGRGFVGTGMAPLFTGHDRKHYFIDPPQGLTWPDHACAYDDVALVCVPTPMRADGSCDVTAVTETVTRCMASLIVIKSTVPPGTTAALCKATGKRVVFSPEYMGESRYWTPPEFPHPRDVQTHGFVIVGGDARACSEYIDLLMPVLGPATRFRTMGSTEAECVKYAENSFFALKVTFANELRRLCTLLDANYHSVREGWLDDPRVGPMHTAAFKAAPGFGGKCLPKDISALAATFRELGAPSPLLEAVIRTNGHEGGQ